MAKINSKPKYPLKFPLDMEDFMVGTDSKTGKTISIQVASLFNSNLYLGSLGELCIIYPETTTEDCETGEITTLPLQLSTVFMAFEQCICDNKLAIAELTILINNITNNLANVKDRVENVICYDTNKQGFIVRYYDIDDNEVISLRLFKDVSETVIAEPTSWVYGSCSNPTTTVSGVTFTSGNCC